MKTLILTGGQGKRLEPLTSTRPKSMIEICGEPVILRLVKSVKEVGISHADIVIGSKGGQIGALLSQNIKNFSVKLIEQQQPSGVGNAILTASHRILPTDYFLLVYGDILFSGNMIESLLNSFQTRQKPLAAICLPPDTRDYGNIYMDHEMRILKILEKPDRSDLGNYVLAGAFVLPGTILDHLKSNNGNFIASLLSLEEGLYASIWEGEWINLGYPWDILNANQLIMSTWKESRIASDVVFEPGSEIQGPVVIESGVVLKSGAYVLGPCFIGEGSFIGHNALLRNYTTIGNRSIVGFGVELKNSVLFHQTEIGRLSFIGDSILGEGVNIGSGTVMVNINLDHSNIQVKFPGKSIDSGLKKLGSLVGDKAWIGAGHTLSPGTKIAPGSVIPHNITVSSNL